VFAYNLTSVAIQSFVHSRSFYPGFFLVFTIRR